MARPASTRLKVNPPLGTLPVLQYCTPDQLEVDPAYQRGLDSGPSQALIRRIAVHWDWGLCQPLIVARRGGPGSGQALFVVDGQHRLAAAKLRGDIHQLPCVVASYADAADEAACFVALNQQRRPLGRLVVFKAELAAGDPEARAVAGAVEAVGLRIAASTNLETSPPGTLSNVTGLLACLRIHGEAVLEAALDVLAESFKGQKLRYAGTIFPGLAEIVAAEMARDPAFRDGDRFALMTEMLGGAWQTDWYKDVLSAVAADPNLNRKRASAVVLRAAWAECVDAVEEDNLPVAAE